MYINVYIYTYVYISVSCVWTMAELPSSKNRMPPAKAIE